MKVYSQNITVTWSVKSPVTYREGFELAFPLKKIIRPGYIPPGMFNKYGTGWRKQTVNNNMMIIIITTSTMIIIVIIEIIIIFKIITIIIMIIILI